LLPVFLLVAELTVLSSAYAGRIYRQWVRLCLILPTLAIIAYLLYLPNWLPSYGTRDFSFSERLITQPVILMDYLRAILTMRVGGLGLFHDDFPIYSEFLSPKPLLSALVLSASLVVAVIYRRRFPVVVLVCSGSLLGICWSQPLSRLNCILSTATIYP